MVANNGNFVLADEREETRRGRGGRRVKTSVFTAPDSTGNWWGDAAVTFHPCQIVCYNGGRRKYLRLQFRRWSGAEKVPHLRSLRFWQTRQVSGLSAKMSWSFRTGRYAATLPIHLTANGLKKLGFKVVYLTANTPAPAAKLLTPADAAKIKIMRRRFEKWAGVWNWLHPGKHPH